MRGNERVFEANNGNIVLQFFPEEIADIRVGKVSTVEMISWLLEEIDCAFIGESYCLDNYRMGATIYNTYSDLCYVIDFLDVENILMNGLQLMFIARAPDEGDREILEREGYND